MKEKVTRRGGTRWIDTSDRPRTADRKCFLVLPRAMWENEFIGFRDVSTLVPHVMVASAQGGLRGVPVVFEEALEFKPIFTT